jgi:hypothetical protein
MSYELCPHCFSTLNPPKRGCRKEVFTLLLQRDGGPVGEGDFPSKKNVGDTLRTLKADGYIYQDTNGYYLTIKGIKLLEARGEDVSKIINRIKQRTNHKAKTRELLSLLGELA